MVLQFVEVAVTNIKTVIFVIVEYCILSSLKRSKSKKQKYNMHLAVKEVTKDQTIMKNLFTSNFPLLKCLSNTCKKKENYSRCIILPFALLYAWNNFNYSTEQRTTLVYWYLICTALNSTVRSDLGAFLFLFFEIFWFGFFYRFVVLFPNTRYQDQHQLDLLA